MRHKSTLPKSRVIYTIAVIGFIYTIHLVLPMYVSSSFLSLFATENTIGILYMLASAITILGFLFIPIFLRKVGNYTTALWLIVIQMFLFYGLTIASDPLTIAILFILQMAVVALMGFCFDVFLEVYSTVQNVGSVRGMYLTTMNIAWIIAPLVASMIVGVANDYHGVYIAGLYMLFPLLYLVYKNFPKFRDPHYTHPTLFQTYAHVRADPNRSRLFIANITLQTFYAWMVVYSPIYLHEVMGFDWTAIGIILTIMLLPFPIVQWPLGKLADKRFGEKEIMTLGFALLGLSSIALASIVSANVFIWALALFITRVGAASVEVMIETYFFKTVHPKDSNMLGFFRVTRPLAYFVAPIITGIVLIFTKDQSVLFVVLGILCLLAMIPAWTLKDTN